MAFSNDPIITVVGFVGGEPTLRNLNDETGTAVCSISIANTERKMINGSWQDVRTNWYRATLWKKQAEEAAETIRKGDRVAVTGRFTITEFEKDGEKRTALEINADWIGVLPKPIASIDTTKSDKGGSPW